MDNQIKKYTRLAIESTIQACKVNAAAGRSLAEVDVEEIAKAVMNQAFHRSSPKGVAVHAYPTDVFNMNPGEDFNVWSARQDAEMARLEDISKNLAEGEVVGALLHFPVGDGSAIYRVSSKEPLEFEHVPYGDGYQVMDVALNGVDLEYIEGVINHNRKKISSFTPR